MVKRIQFENDKTNCMFVIDHETGNSLFLIVHCPLPYNVGIKELSLIGEGSEQFLHYQPVEK